jgi:16S rRNA G1207 methylase RsmC
MNDHQARMLKSRQICLEHAADLVASAERVLKDNGYLVLVADRVMSERIRQAPTDPKS